MAGEFTNFGATAFTYIKGRIGYYSGYNNRVDADTACSDRDSDTNRFRRIVEPFHQAADNFVPTLRFGDIGLQLFRGVTAFRRVLPHGA